MLPVDVGWVEAKRSAGRDPTSTACRELLGLAALDPTYFDRPRLTAGGRRKEKFSGKPMQQLTIRIESKSGTTQRLLSVRELVIAGWTGRDKEAVEKHIAELEALGVNRPPHTPMFYRVSSARLTTVAIIEVIGSSSTGEVEFILAGLDGEVLVGVGSDHTDRQLETVGIAVAKQICDKPVGATFWPLREVEGHWDQLLLRSRVTIDGTPHLYQGGSVAELLSPADLVRRYANADRLDDGVVMFGGTLAVHGGLRPAQRFEGELEDPVLKRRISFAYEIHTLPNGG